MKKHLLLIFALISLFSLMSFTVDYGQKPKEQTQKVGMLSDIVGAPIIIAPPPSTITVFRGSNVSFKVTFISDLQVDGVLTKINKYGAKERLQRDYTLHIIGNDMIITLDEVREADEGEYDLEIFNRKGSVSVRFKLNIILY